MDQIQQAPLFHNDLDELILKHLDTPTRSKLRLVSHAARAAVDKLSILGDFDKDDIDFDDPPEATGFGISSLVNPHRPNLQRLLLTLPVYELTGEQFDTLCSAYWPELTRIHLVLDGMYRRQDKRHKDRCIDFSALGASNFDNLKNLTIAGLQTEYIGTKDQTPGYTLGRYHSRMFRSIPQIINFQGAFANAAFLENLERLILRSVYISVKEMECLVECAMPKLHTLALCWIHKEVIHPDWVDEAVELGVGKDSQLYCRVLSTSKQWPALRVLHLAGMETGLHGMYRILTQDPWTCLDTLILDGVDLYQSNIEHLARAPLHLRLKVLVIQQRWGRLELEFALRNTEWPALECLALSMDPYEIKGAIRSIIAPNLQYLAFNLPFNFHQDGPSVDTLHDWHEIFNMAKRRWEGIDILVNINEELTDTLFNRDYCFVYSDE